MEELRTADRARMILGDPKAHAGWRCACGSDTGSSVMRVEGMACVPTVTGEIECVACGDITRPPE